jgi:hypothetical protein
MLVLVLILMLAGTVWGWRHGYVAFDVTTAVWPIVLAIVLLMVRMVSAPWPVRHVCRCGRVRSSDQPPPVPRGLRGRNGAGDAAAALRAPGPILLIDYAG